MQNSFTKDLFDSRHRGHLWKVRAAVLAGACLTFPVPAEASVYQATPLVASDPLLAPHFDPNLSNAWGMAYSPTGPFVVTNPGGGQGPTTGTGPGGMATFYDGSGAIVGAPIAIPSAGPPHGSPTGVVYNGDPTGFLITQGGTTAPATYLYATEDGLIVGSTGSGPAAVAFHNPPGAAAYVGLAIATGVAYAGKPSGTILYAANIRTGMIDVFDKGFQMIGSFTDPNLPTTGPGPTKFGPFNVQVLDGQLYVTFAQKIDPATGKQPSGPGEGYVDRFNLDGTGLQRLVSNGVLNEPWALDIAPQGFGQYGGDLLVGNFGDGQYGGEIAAFDPATGSFKGVLEDAYGHPIAIPGLWALINGNGGQAGDPNTVYYSAALDETVGGKFFDDGGGIIGRLDVAEPGSAALLLTVLIGLAVRRRASHTPDQEKRMSSPARAVNSA